MNEEYGLKGCVQKLEQRRQSRLDSERLQQTSDHHSFDVEFSPLGQVLRETYYTYGGEVHLSERFVYSESGKLIHTEKFDNKGVSVGWSELTYFEAKCEWINRNSAGVIVSSGISEYDGKRLVLTSSFDEQGRPRTNKTFDYSGGKLAKSDSLYFLPDGTPGERWLADYDSEGRIRKTYGLKPDGSPLGDGKYLYEYDNEGRQSKVWSFNEYEKGAANHVTIYEYVNDDCRNWIERREFHLWRDSSYRSKAITTRRLQYYPDGGQPDRFIQPCVNKRS